MTIGAIVLAAGGSRRLGHAKQLVPYRGEAMLARVVRAVTSSRCDGACVVLGARALDVLPVVLGAGAEILHDRAWESGMASSIHCGLDWAARAGHDAILLCVCDQPHLTAGHLDALIGIHAAGGEVVASRYGEVVGVPALFPRAMFGALRELSGDRGARSLLAGCRPRVVRWDLGVFDVDTPRDVVLLTDEP